MPPEIIQWQQQIVPLANLKPYERNPRKHDAKAHARLKSKIERFGYHGRIIATQQMKVIGGHLRLAVLKELGIDPVAILVAPRPLTENEYRELLITDNLQDGAWNMDLLSTDFTLPELEEWGMPEAWMPANSPYSGLTDPDDVPLTPTAPVSMVGDLWLLGAYFECEVCRKEYTYVEGKGMKECPCEKKAV